MTRALLLLLAGAPAIGVAQAPVASAIPRFGIALAEGTPRGELAGVVRPPTGFTTWVSLPLASRSPLGLRAEFSILTVPEERTTLAPSDDTTLELTLRSTLGFTGVGPRIEARVGPAIVAASAMGGLTRVIADLNGRLAQGDQLTSVALSESENVLAVKGVLDLYVPLLSGSRDAALALTAGVDWTTSGRAAVVRSNSLRITGPGEVRAGQDEAPVTLTAWRVGVGLFF